ncbi:rRNA maturation RNase YbeY [Niabella sp. CC-SYL272]|uniref:rRNA maturation RNase YbeY n=1 Tax=Niabella agricola TaxID=2891571 RepID=UPI001F21EC24|nr:rRNA maturation RNase YbeY [Niabella agricola]MCF3110594.1 rRNA maturation RNase YbeY [Niabella agricola]
MKHLPQITFSFRKNISLKDRNRLKHSLAILFRENNRELDMLHYVFCGDEEILEINRQYLKHDYYTDIITFDLREKPSEPMVADIFISVDTVRSNARGLNLSISKELHRVIFHGALHLCGYNDKTEAEQKLMRTKEDECLQRYGFK